MNPNASHSISPAHLVFSLFKYRSLIYQMSRREVVGRYKGSILGLGWSFFNPVLMLAVYTFVFSVIFKARWGIEGGESRVDFALVLFAGLIVHAFFAEVLNASPNMILQNTNYVKKVVFPLETLPVISAGCAIFHAFISLLVLLVSLVIVKGALNWTIIFVPIVIVPIIFVTIGLSWILASLGTFLRDISQSIAILTTVMLFLAPIFYPLHFIPEAYHIYIMMNPLTFIIQQLREVVIFGNFPSWGGVAIYWVVSLIVLWIGYAWFQKTRRGFADVL